MSRHFLFILAAILCLGPYLSAQDLKNPPPSSVTYESHKGKTKLFLQADHTFEYIDTQAKGPFSLARASGIWRGSGDTLSLTSTNPSHERAVLQVIESFDSSLSSPSFEVFDKSGNEISLVTIQLNEDSIFCLHNGISGDTCFGPTPDDIRAIRIFYGDLSGTRTRSYVYFTQKQGSNLFEVRVDKDNPLAGSQPDLNFKNQPLILKKRKAVLSGYGKLKLKKM